MSGVKVGLVIVGRMNEAEDACRNPHTSQRIVSPYSVQYSGHGAPMTRVDFHGGPGCNRYSEEQKRKQGGSLHA